MAARLSFVTIFGIIALLALMENTLAAGTDCSKRPPKIDPIICCALPNIVTDDIMETCKMTIPPPPPPPRHAGPSSMSGEDVSMSDESKYPQPTGPPHYGPRPNHHHHRRPHGPPMLPCFMTCVLNETGILMATPDAKLNENNLSSYLKLALVNATDMIPTMEKSFKTCAAKGEEMRAKMKEFMQKKQASSASSTDSSSSSSSTEDRMMRHPRPHHRCPPFAAHLMGCVFRESLMNCPDSLWNNTTECNEIRDHMKNCKPPKFNDKSETSNLLEEM